MQAHPRLGLTDCHMDVIWYDCIAILKRLEGDLHSTSKVLLDLWALDLHGRKKLQCEGVTSGWAGGEITH